MGRKGGGGGMYQVSGDRGHDGDYVDRRGGGRGGGSRGGRSGGGGGRGSRGKANVGYLNPAAPSFIQRLRAEHGLKSSEESHAEQMAMKRQSASSDPDAPTVVTPQDLDTRPVMPDEAPQVVVLKKKHLSLEEAELFMEKGASGLEGVLEPAAKRARTEGDEAAVDPPRGMGEKSSKLKKEKSGKKKSKSKVVDGALSKKLNKKNTSMLSFNEDDV